MEKIIPGKQQHPMENHQQIHKIDQEKNVIFIIMKIIKQ